MAPRKKTPLARAKKAFADRRKRVNRFLKSNSLARLGRRKTKQVRRATKRITKQANRSYRKLKKTQKRVLKRLPKQLKRTKKKTLRTVRMARKSLKRSLRISRKLFRRLSKAYQLRGKQLNARRREQRQEIRGTFDTSRSRIVQASADPGASRPGEPPKMRTGQGRYSIKAELRKRGKQIVSRTYVDKKIAGYMAMYEFRQDGKQRPFLKPGLMNNLKAFQTKVGAELKRAATQVPKKRASVK